MTYRPFAAVLLLGFTACSSPSSRKEEAPVKEKAQVTDRLIARPTTLPRTYWSLDTSAQQSDTLLAGSPAYHIRVVTTCLNDSAVVNRIGAGSGFALDVSHNYESDLSISRGQQPWLHERLTKAHFQQDTLVQTLGSLSELALSRTTFLAYTDGAFRFATRLGVPDSDLFVEAEVAVNPEQGLRIVKVQEPAEQ